MQQPGSREGLGVCFYIVLLRDFALGFMFFFLDKKEPKNQECRIASGRHSAQRAWVVTLMAFTYLSVFLVFKPITVVSSTPCHPGACRRPL